MAIPDFHLCDICGGNAMQKPLFVKTGSESDPSGNGSEDAGFYVDLCYEHAYAALKQVVREGDRYDIVDVLRKWIDRNKAANAREAT